MSTHSPPRRGRHRKRLSALRLSSDTTVSTLPAYTPPPWSKGRDFPPDGDLSDRPPDYPDSAEEGDADTDSDDPRSAPYYPPPLPLSPSRRLYRTQSTRTHRRQPSAAADPYLDSLLARSVHALEMSNALLQSSMSTQSSLSAVLAADSPVDRTLEARAHMLSTRIAGNRDLHETWVDDLDEISRSVEDLVEEGGDTTELQPLPDEDFVSQSLPVSGFADRMQRRGHLRRPSLDLRIASTPQLQYSNHDRSHFVAPAPRALTMYVDSTDDPDSITLPPTLGLRTSHLPPTPLPSQTFSDPGPEAPADTNKRLVDVLSSYVSRSPPRPSTSVSSSPRKSSSLSTRSGRSSSTSSHTVRHVRPSPPVKPPSASPSDARSRSLTPMRNLSPALPSRPMTPPIEELSTSSESSSSGTMHVDRTVESLRNILDRQPPPPPKPTSPRPAFLSPPSVAPVAGTSTATASISRMFTKARHSSSTRPPSPPRQSVLKHRSAPPTPNPSSTPTPNSTPAPSAPPTPTLLGIPGAFGFTRSRTSSAASSGRSTPTPKRISFAELPEPHVGASSSKLRDKKAGARDGGGKARRRRGRGAQGRGKEEDEGGGWWTGWLLGAAGTGSGSGLSLSASREERVPGGLGSSWSVRPGYGGSLEEWGA
ncbi:hypothetical protein IEO21_07232 [Rhodonia placenta]|uniref:Uncharacterized protein n=1 Tax=Rhodonia placenta TaxID=104341 RepID=A0A8H7TZZ4_9APHY|nr:hypothetical protein IEO21_07232 [Postia placenta]